MKRYIRLVIIVSAIGFCFAKYEGWPEEIVKLLEDKELQNWEPTGIKAENFKYYQSGFDVDGKPVWIMEWGRWNLRKVVEHKLTAEFDKYTDQMCANLALSLVNATQDGDEFNPSLNIIIDADGFSPEQLGSTETLVFILRLFRTSLEKLRRISVKTYVINANYVVDNLISILRPVLGDAIEEVKIFGTNKSKWQARLVHDIPLDALPEIYGGKKGFKPIKVFG